MSTAALTRVAFIGTGFMGLPMARRVAGAGFPLSVYNRTAAKAAPLAEDCGATVCATAAEAAAAAELCVILMLADFAACKAVITEMGDALRGKPVVNMTTIAPGEALACRDLCASHGADVYADCPVLGSTPQAVAGSLKVLLTCPDDAAFTLLEGVLTTMGPVTRVSTETGKSASLKLALNTLIAAQTAGLATAMGLADRSGVDTEVFREIASNSVIWAPYCGFKFPMMQSRAYPAAMPSYLMAKDATLIASEAQRLGLDTTFADGVRDAFCTARDAGHADDDLAVVYETINPKDGKGGANK
jgi:3-hydroxyisobutyrate dehydrogenase